MYGLANHSSIKHLHEQLAKLMRESEDEGLTLSNNVLYEYDERRTNLYRSGSLARNTEQSVFCMRFLKVELERIACIGIRGLGSLP